MNKTPKEYYADWRKNNRDKVRAYNAKRRDIRLAQAAEWRLKNPERVRFLSRRWHQKNQIKIKAQRALNYLIRYGKMARPTECSQCGKSGKIQAHHHDYSKPLDVIWVCIECHELIHHGPVPDSRIAIIDKK